MLPKLDTAVFKVVVPSLQREILMRPFLVREEKILLMAKQSGEKDQIFLAIKQVIQNCIVDEMIDVSKLPYFDIEYLFINLRINSVGDFIEVEITDPETGNKNQATVNLNDIAIIKTEVSNKVVLGENTALVMKHPTLDEISKVTTDSDVQAFFDTLKYSIESVFHNDQSYEFSNYSDQEKDEFIDSLSVDNITKCKDFIAAMPSVEVEAKWKTGKTDKSMKLKGINSFFLILLGHNNLKNYFKLIFNMAQHHGYSIAELENMIPFELEIYSSMLIDYLDQKKNEQEAARR